MKKNKEFISIINNLANMSVIKFNTNLDKESDVLKLFPGYKKEDIIDFIYEGIKNDLFFTPKKLDKNDFSRDKSFPIVINWLLISDKKILFKNSLFLSKIKKNKYLFNVIYKKSVFLSNLFLDGYYLESINIEKADNTIINEIFLIDDDSERYKKMDLLIKNIDFFSSKFSNKYKKELFLFNKNAYVKIHQIMMKQTETQRRDTLRSLSKKRKEEILLQAKQERDN